MPPFWPGPGSTCEPGGRPAIPSKQQYKIADVCRVLDIQPYVLRYWHTEFPVLASKKSAGSRRDYDAEDLETIRRIKELLYDEGYTIASAKKKLAAELEEGGVRGRPLMATETQANGGEEPAEIELPAEEGHWDDEGTEPADGKEPEAEDALESSPAAMKEASDVGEIGALTRRVERLEGGVAALVSQARQLAAELKPEMGIDDD